MEDYIILMKKYGNEIIENTFKDIEYIHKEENRFTFEDQRKATKYSYTNSGRLEESSLFEYIVYRMPEE